MSPSLKYWDGTAWQTLFGGAIAGPAGGDLAGSFPNPTLNLDHACVVRSGTAFSLATAAAAAIPFDTVIYDPSGLWAASPNPTRLTIKQAGIYVIVAQCQFGASATGSRIVYLNKNGSSFNTNTHIAVSGTLGPVLQVVGIRDFAVGDYLEFVAYQNSGAALTLVAGNPWWPQMSIHRLGPI